jgi:hypothetical protein
VVAYNAGMKLALLGADDESLTLVRWAVEAAEHQLVAAYDVGSRAADVQRLAPAARLGESWETLVLGSAVDAVIVGRGVAGLAEQTGIPDNERRAEQLRKLAQAAVPMLVICPACEAIIGFEVEMIRRDTHAVIMPIVPGASHPAVLRIEELVSWRQSSPIGNIEQITLEREQADRSRDAVLVQLSRDAGLLRRLIGTIQSVSASGPSAPIGGDPLGPKLKEPLSLANLNVHLGGDEGLAARWSMAPALSGAQGKLTVIGQRGKAVLHMPPATNWSLEIVGDKNATETFGPHNDAQSNFWKLTHALATDEFYDELAWLDASRDQEVAEAVDRSLQRGRTIELFNEEHTEEESFKGIMAMGGCLLLLMALAAVLLATVVEGLRLPMRNWPLFQLWPFYLIVPIGAFLLLQLLQLAVKRDPPMGADLRRWMGGQGTGR